VINPDLDLTDDLAAAHRLQAVLGWTDLVHTHCSARSLLDPDTYYLAPFGRLFEEVEPSTLVRVHLDGTVLDDRTGAGVHPAAMGLHSAILAARPDVGCVVHTHSVAGAAVSAQEGGLRMVSQHAMRFHGAIGTHEHSGLTLAEGDGAALVASLGTHDALILRNHGLLTCGPTVPAAFEVMWFLEKACAIQVAAGAGPLVEPAPEIAAKVARQFARPERAAVVDATWAALLRLLDRETR